MLFIRRNYRVGMGIFFHKSSPSLPFKGFTISNLTLHVKFQLLWYGGFTVHLRRDTLWNIPLSKAWLLFNVSYIFAMKKQSHKEFDRNVFFPLNGHIYFIPFIKQTYQKCKWLRPWTWISPAERTTDYWTSSTSFLISHYSKQQLTRQITVNWNENTNAT